MYDFESGRQPLGLTSDPIWLQNVTIGILFCSLKKMNTSIQQGCIKLIRSAVYLNSSFIKESEKKYHGFHKNAPNQHIKIFLKDRLLKNVVLHLEKLHFKISAIKRLTSINRIQSKSIILKNTKSNINS